MYNEPKNSIAYTTHNHQHAQFGSGARDAIDADGELQETERGMVAIFQLMLGGEGLGIHERFSDLGGDSLLAINVAAKIERHFGRRVSFADVMEQQSPHNLARLLLGKRFGRVHSSLVKLQTGGDLPPLFCFHPYGGYVDNYTQLAKLFGPEQAVYGLAAQGLGSDAVPYADLVDMVANYLKIVRDVQPQGPYYLLGHSVGGILAWEMACQLQAQGQTVAFLGLFDVKAENCLKQPLYRSSAYACRRVPEWLSDDAAILGVFFPQLMLIWPLLESIAKPDQRSYLLKAGVAAGTMREVGELDITRIIAVIKANDQALRGFALKPYAGRVVQFAANDGYRLQFGEEVDDDLGIARLATNGLEVELVPGDHRSLMEAPNVQILHKKLMRHLEASSSLSDLGNVGCKTA